jgi:hypothetical protein
MCGQRIFLPRARRGRYALKIQKEVGFHGMGNVEAWKGARTPRQWLPPVPSLSSEPAGKRSS